MSLFPVSEAVACPQKSWRLIREPPARAHLCSMKTAPSWLLRRRNSRRSFRSPAGWNTILRTSGLHSWPWRERPCERPGSVRLRSLPLELPISVKPRCCGIVGQASRFIMRLSGRIDERLTTARRCRKVRGLPIFVSAPGWSSTAIFLRRRLRGC